MMESQYYLYMLTPLHSVELFMYAHACYIFMNMNNISFKITSFTCYTAKHITIESYMAS